MSSKLTLSQGRNGSIKPVTIASKKKRGYADPERILYGEGEMQEGVTSESNSRSASVGFNVVSEKGYPYPEVHQYGTKDGKLKARPFLPMDEDGELARHVEEEILDILDEHFLP